MGFNSGFKGLKGISYARCDVCVASIRIMVCRIFLTSLTLCISS